MEFCLSHLFSLRITMIKCCLPWYWHRLSWHRPISVIKYHVVLMSRLRVKVLARWQPSSPLISLCTDPCTVYTFGCWAPSLSANSFLTLLILDVVCSSLGEPSYRCDANQACPGPALLSVYQKLQLREKQIKQLRSPILLSPKGWAVSLAILPTLPSCGTFAHMAKRMMPHMHMHVSSHVHYGCAVH